jgi:hypothetical protein
MAYGILTRGLPELFQQIEARWLSVLAFAFRSKIGEKIKITAQSPVPPCQEPLRCEIGKAFVTVPAA